MQAHEIQVTKTARYFTLGNPKGEEIDLWFVIHGYGQLGEYFIQNFKPLENEKSLIVAPEGLSRFYLGENKWKRVGASWMTKMDRLNEIRDHVGFLDQLYARLRYELEGKQVRINLLGFSQGVATAWRWMKLGTIQPDNFVVWAGTIPEEMSPELQGKLDRMNMWILYGTEDEYLNEKLAKKRIDKFRQLVPGIKVIRFEDRHRINEEALEELIQQMG